MNPYPAERSVLVLDNCRIHHNDALVDLINSAGMCFYYIFPLSKRTRKDVSFCTSLPIHRT